MPTDLIILHTIVALIYIGWSLMLYYYYANFWKMFIWLITSLTIGFIGFFFTFAFTGLLSSGSFANDFCVPSLWTGTITISIFLLVSFSIIILRHFPSSNKSEDILDDSFL